MNQADNLQLDTFDSMFVGGNGNELSVMEEKSRVNVHGNACPPPNIYFSP